MLCRVLLTVLVLTAASASAAPKRYRPPDLEGTWRNDWATPLERDDTDFKTVDVPEAEARAWETRMSDPAQFEADLKKRYPKINLDLAEDPGFDDWRIRLARIDGVARSALIVEPADGKLPWSEAGKARLKAMNAARRGWDDPEQKTTVERCLTGYTAGPPITAGGYLQIVQTPDAVAILVEENQDLRIVRMGQPHGPRQLHPWFGDAVGWYEGDTLVVETTGFHPGQTFRLTGDALVVSPDARIIERFRRVSPSELRYSFEVSDPANYTRVWRGEAPLVKHGKPLIESACHEGDYDTPTTLAGARKEEADRAAALAAFARALRTRPAPAPTPGPRPAPRTAPAAPR